MTAAANDASSCPHSTSSGQSHDYLAPYHRETHGDPCTKKALRRLQSAVPEHPPPPQNTCTLPSGVHARASSSFQLPCPSLNPQTLKLFPSFVSLSPLHSPSPHVALQRPLPSGLVCFASAISGNPEPLVVAAVCPLARAATLCAGRRERATEGTAAIKHQQRPPRHNPNKNLDPLQPCPTSSKRAPASFTGAQHPPKYVSLAVVDTQLVAKFSTQLLSIYHDNLSQGISIMGVCSSSCCGG